MAGVITSSAKQRLSKQETFGIRAGDPDQHTQALEMLDGLDIIALTSADPTPGWEHRLRALRGRILLLAGELAEGHRLLSDAVPALVSLGTEDAADIAQLQALIDDRDTVLHR